MINIYSLLLDESTDPIFSFFPDGTYRYVNNAFARPFKKTPSDIIGKKIWDIFPKDEADKRFAAVKHVFQTGETFEFEVRVPQEIRDKYYLTTVKPIIDETNTVLSIICSSKEITDRKYAEEEIKLKNIELSHLNATKDKFFSIIAHDLKSPLSSLYMTTKIMKTEFHSMSSAEAYEMISLIAKSTEHLYSLLDDLLIWSRSQRGMIEVEISEIDLHYLVNTLKQQMTPDLIAKELEINNEIEIGFNINSDINLLTTIFKNLFSNAIKFSNEGGKISVSSTMGQDNSIVVKVSDTGVGIKADILPKLFNIDHHNVTLGTKKEKGTGLGLILCKEFIEKLNGKIWVESQEMKGSNFYFKLPLI